MNYTQQEGAFIHEESIELVRKLKQLRQRVVRREGVGRPSYEGPSLAKQDSLVGETTPKGMRRLAESPSARAHRARKRKRQPTLAQIETAELAGIQDLGFWRSKTVRKQMFKGENR